VSFRLIVIPPGRDAEVYQTNTEPLPNREAVGMAALRALAAKNIPFGRAGGMAFGRMVRDTPLGVVVTHGESGYSFRTEEF
jgi:hypothetical protein